jgi:hypothetical protein
MAPTEKPRKSSFGLVSEFTLALRERQLQEPAVTSCAICGVRLHARSAKDGIAKFKAHQETQGHRRALRRREAERAPTP